MWQIIGVLVSIVAIFVSLMVAWRQSRVKRIVVDPSEVSLFSIYKPAGNRLKIYYDDVPVKNLIMHRIRITNAGTVPIDASDFVEPLAVTFGKSAKVLAAEVTETKPLKLAVKLRIDSDGTALVLEPSLFNQQDVIELNAVVSESGPPSVTARVRGMHSVEMRRPFDQWTYVTWGAAGTVGLALVGFVPALLAVAIDNYWHLPRPWGFVIVCAGILLTARLRTGRVTTAKDDA